MAEVTHYPNLGAFYEAHPMGPESPFGTCWRDGSGRQHTLWVCHNTGSLYLLDNRSLAVELLATLTPAGEPHCGGGLHGSYCAYQVAALVLEGWDVAIRDPRSLLWVRDRLAMALDLGPGLSLDYGRLARL